MKNTQIITGGAGFIGSNYIYHMLEKYPDYRIVCLDKLTYAGNLSTLKSVMDRPNFRFVKADICDRAAVYKLFEEEKPNVVVNFAAESHVDRSIENPDIFLQTNILGTAVLMDACRKYGIERYHQVSTDEVWVFGKNGSNFIKTMLKLGETHDSLRVVCDQIGTPTYTLDLARLLVDMIETEKYGTYHATNEGGYISWAEFAEEIFHLARKNVKIIPVTTEEYGLSKATRPHNSRLDKTKLIENGFVPLPDWHDALERYLLEIGKYHAN